MRYEILPGPECEACGLELSPSEIEMDLYRAGWYTHKTNPCLKIVGERIDAALREHGVAITSPDGTTRIGTTREYGR